MKREQFKELENFTYFSDFQHTRGNLRKMKFEVYQRLQALRDLLPENNFLKVLSTNAGKHSTNSRHYTGEAIDVFCPMRNISINSFVELALNVGFRGIGVYINASGVPSFHLDIREDFQLWFGSKEGDDKNWTYSELIDFEGE
jgi:hypothetical protein